MVEFVQISPHARGGIRELKHNNYAGVYPLSFCLFFLMLGFLYKEESNSNNDTLSLT